MMGSLFQRPVVAAAAVAVASFSANIHDRLSSLSDDLHERFRPLKFSDSLLASHSANLSKLNETSPSLSASSSSSWMPLISSSQLAKSSFTTVMGGPVPTLKHLIVDTGKSKLPSVPIGSCSSLVASSHILLKSYRLAELSKAPSPVDESNAFTGPSPTSAIPEVLYRWHLPKPDAVDFSNGKKSNCSLEKSRTVVVLLGWLGAKQKHLKRYADWYTSKGFHVISFTFPMAEVMSYQVGGKAEQNVDLLANHLAEWLEEEHGKNLVFHTFSNTGWLTYGAILEKFQKQDHELMGRIKGCIVDSAPVAAPDPQVWASGFSAAFLKKHSVATKGYSNTSELGEPKPAFTESAILLVLEKFFDVVLNLPTVNRRLSNVLGQLTSGQPSCPQLYIYSSADKVIPAGSVESFIATQQNSGREVRSCNFISTPHVDHFRHQPELYTSQLLKFLDDCVLACSKRC